MKNIDKIIDDAYSSLTRMQRIKRDRKKRMLCTLLSCVLLFVSPAIQVCSLVFFGSTRGEVFFNSPPGGFIVSMEVFLAVFSISDLVLYLLRRYINSESCSSVRDLVRTLHVIFLCAFVIGVYAAL